MPNGRSIVLERQSGADTQGFAGLDDKVDYHWLRLFAAAALSTVLGVGSEFDVNVPIGCAFAQARCSLAIRPNAFGKIVMSRSVSWKSTKGWHQGVAQLDKELAGASLSRAPNAMAGVLTWTSSNHFSERLRAGSPHPSTFSPISKYG
jgi:hypothetical protein